MELFVIWDFQETVGQNAGGGGEAGTGRSGGKGTTYS